MRYLMLLVTKANKFTANPGSNKHPNKKQTDYAAVFFGAYKATEIQNGNPEGSVLILSGTGVY